MTLLIEVGPDNGGRLLSVRTIVERRNNTIHSAKLVFHPDQRSKLDVVSQSTKTEDHNESEVLDRVIVKSENKINPFECAIIKPGCDFQLPTLLIESSLEMAGSHFGSVWICPDTSNSEGFSFRDFSKPTKSKIEEFDASFCSRPVQPAKSVYETLLIYTRMG